MEKAIVLLSGGQDSATCLFWAKEKFSLVEALFIHYEQRHKIEYKSARKLCEAEKIFFHELSVPAFKEIGGTAMIEEKTITNPEHGIPNTFVPGRNILFLTLAAALGYQRESTHLVIGVNEADYSGYPDCRSDFIRQMEKTLSLGMDTKITIHTPLQFLDKAQIWALANQLGVLERIVKETHTCYVGDHSIMNEWGYGCGICPACKLRANGYYKFLERQNSKNQEAIGE
jgi:7-cyano-7-deazaguanine synthase